MDLSIIGSGYVGLVTGACFADVGHNVICVDNDVQKIKQLQAGEVPIYEPGLEEIIHRNVSARRLRFTGSIEEGVSNSQIADTALMYEIFSARNEFAQCLMSSALLISVTRIGAINGS